MKEGGFQEKIHRQTSSRMVGRESPRIWKKIPVYAAREEELMPHSM